MHAPQEHCLVAQWQHLGPETRWHGRGLRASAGNRAPDAFPFYFTIQKELLQQLGARWEEENLVEGPLCVIDSRLVAHREHRRWEAAAR